LLSSPFFEKYFSQRNLKKKKKKNKGKIKKKKKKKKKKKEKTAAAALAAEYCLLYMIASSRIVSRAPCREEEERKHSEK